MCRPQTTCLNSKLIINNQDTRREKENKQTCLHLFCDLSSAYLKKFGLTVPLLVPSNNKRPNNHYVGARWIYA